MIHHRTAGDGAPLRIAMLGDSTVSGVGALDVHGTLPVQTAERVAALLSRPVEITGFGVSGARTGQLRGVQDTDLGQPDVVVVVVGGNDVIHLTPPWRLRRQSRALLAGLPKPVVLAGVPRFTGATAIPQPLRWLAVRVAAVVRRVQRQVAAEMDGVSFVDIAAEASPRFQGVSEAMSPDRFHPADVGYGFWADAIAAAVVRAR